ncbi:MAG TPA: efflux RND transporter permease subunit [Kofleriaceae bacterium]|nr:efflux RND transporter permease subunit [Kofleriaceae bacterium]
MRLAGRPAGIAALAAIAGLAGCRRAAVDKEGGPGAPAAARDAGGPAPGTAPAELAVTVALPGGSSDAVEGMAVLPLEEALASVGGAATMRAIAAPGRAELRLGFASEEAARAALPSVRAALGTVRRQLPADTEPPTCALLPSGPRVFLVLRTDDRTSAVMARLIADRVRDRLLTEVGVHEVRLCAGVRPETLVAIDAARLPAYGVDAGKVLDALAAAAGPRDSTPEALAGLEVDRRDGAVVRVGDLATVTAGAFPDACAARGAGRESLSVAEVAVARGTGFDAAVARAAAEMPAGAELTALTADVDLRVPLAGSSIEAADAAVARLVDAVPDARVIGLVEREGHWSPGAWPPESLGPSLRLLIDLPPGATDVAAATTRLRQAASQSAAAAPAGPATPAPGMLAIQIDRARAAALGIAPGAVERIARLATTGVVVGSESRAHARLRVRIGRDDAPPDLTTVMVPTTGGKSVPLAAVVSVTEPGPPILRAARQRTK